jgi:hypothetical protein
MCVSVCAHVCACVYMCLCVCVSVFEGCKEEWCIVKQVIGGSACVDELLARKLEK